VVQNCFVSIETPLPARFPRSVIPVWALVVIGAILVGIFAPHSRAIGWLPIVMFGGVMATFAIQLALDEKRGLVNRVIASLGGAIILLAIATGILALLAA
jgi:hypothetical protein